MKYLYLALCLFVFNFSFAQTYFEGEIIYQESIEKKDSSFDPSTIPSYPSSYSVLHFKEGRFVSQPEAGTVEYLYFDNVRNMLFYKIRELDTLFYEYYRDLNENQDSVTSVTIQEMTDTILGRVCNRLILRTPRMTLTFMYSPSIEINPDWFKDTKGGYYNIIYSKMRSVYLGFNIETSQYLSKSRATKIIYRKIDDTFFPDIDHMPIKEL